MSVRTDVINLSVNVNGNKAQSELNNLRKKAADIKFEMQGLTKGTKEYISKKAELGQVTGAMDALKKQIGLAALSQKELVRELTTLKNLRGSVTPFSDEYKKLDASIKQVETRLHSVKTGMQGMTTFTGKLKEEIKSFGTIVVGYLGFQFIASQIKSIISGLGKLSGQFSDIRKVTGLSEEAVKGLNDELLKIDTRTSTSQLREMAVAAGKLGKESSQDILEFVRAADQISVALGDDLSGGTEEIMKNLGKISQVFKTEELFGTENGLLKIGSAINELSAASNAGADYMVDFSKRMAGVAPLAGVNIQQILGLGATLDQFGQTAEVSSTALSKLFIKMASDSTQFAKYARMNVGDFKALMEKDFMGALIRMLEGVRKNSNGINELAASLGDLGVDGGRVIGVLGTLANNIPVLRNQIQLSNAAFEEGTSITKEFGIQNNDLAATLEKIGKEFDKLRENNVFKDFLTAAANTVLRFIQVVKDLPALFERYKFTIIALAVSFTLLTKNILLSAAAWALEKAAMVADAVLVARRLAILLLSAGYNLLTGNITRAAAAWTLFNRAISANAIGLIVTALIGVGLALDKILSKTKELTAAQRVGAELSKRVSESTEETKTKIELLTKVANDNNESLVNRKKALSALIAIAPDYLSKLTLENLNTAEGTNLLKQYIEQLSARAEAEAKYSLLVEKRKARQQGYEDIRNVDGGARRNFTEAQITTSIDFNRGVGLAPQIFKDMAKLNDEIAALEKSIQDSVAKNLPDVVNGGNTSGGTNTQNNTSVVPDKKFNKEYNSLKKDFEKFQRDVEDIRKKASMLDEDAEAKEIAAITERYQELFDRAQTFYKKNIISKKQLNEDEAKLEEAKYKEILRVHKKYSDIEIKSKNTELYTNKLEEIEKEAENERRAQLEKYSQGLIDGETYENSLTDINRKETAKRIAIHQVYADLIDKAGTELVKDKKALEKELTDELLNQGKAREKLLELEKEAKQNLTLRTISAMGPGGQRKEGIAQATKERDERIAALKKEMEDAGITVTQELLEQSAVYQEIMEDWQSKIKDSNAAFWDGIAKFITDYGQIIMNVWASVNDFIKAKEDKALAEEKQRNNVRKTEYKKQLDGKLISRAQYDKKVEQADQELDKKTKEIQREQAKREKALNLFNAIISTAAGVAKALGSAPPPANFILAAAVGVAGALQAAAIANSPLPELGTGYWLKSGPKHSEPGKGTRVLIERDEAVMSAAAMRDQRRYSVTGTSAQITSFLNARNGGASWATGASVKINPDMPKIMAGGGYLGQSSTAAGSNNMEMLLSQMVLEQQRSTNKQQETLEAVSNWKLNSKSWVSIKEYREQEKLYDDAKRASAL